MEKEEVLKRLKDKGFGKKKSNWYKKAKERQRQRNIRDNEKDDSRNS